MKKQYFFFMPVILFVILLIGKLTCNPIQQKLFNKKTVNDVLSKIGSRILALLSKEFENHKLRFPPEKIVLVSYKEERVLELWALDKKKYTKIKDYSIQGASGWSGPKLIRGDFQVPEGIYNIIGLNPNSNFHLSLHLNYPNQFDIEMSTMDKRKDLGDNIFIHGSNKSIGCLAMGDEMIEELFVLVATVGKENTKIIIAPNRELKKHESISYPNWIDILYKNIKEEIAKLHQQSSN